MEKTTLLGVSVRPWQNGKRLTVEIQHQGKLELDLPFDVAAHLAGLLTAPNPKSDPS